MVTEIELIRVESLGLTIDGNRIIDSLSLALGRGEFVGLIGPNGAGKTTLLKLMLGIHKPDTGRIFLRGQPLQEIRPRERARSIAYLSQDTATSFAFPVLDILLMGRYPFLGRFGRESEADLEKAHRALAYVGLAGFEDRYFNELSGGEQQLVLFAKVLVQEAELLLLDEPTSNLDIRHQDLFFSMASELTREKKAVVAALHNLNTASQYCSRLVLLDRGAIAADGPPKEVLRTEILNRVYGTETVITPNVATGSLMVNVLPKVFKGRGPRIHVIGGAGSAINLTRELSRLGFRLRGGLAHQFDDDPRLWRCLENESACIDAFSHI